MGRVDSDLCARGVGARLESVTIGMRPCAARSRDGELRPGGVRQKSRLVNEASGEASGASSGHTFVCSAPRWEPIFGSSETSLKEAK